MNGLNKKEIKKIKRNVAKNGARYEGYYYSIEEIITYEDIKIILDCTYNYGIELGKLGDSERLDYIITTLARELNYQKFKRFIPHFMNI